MPRRRRPRPAHARVARGQVPSRARGGRCSGQPVEAEHDRIPDRSPLSFERDPSAASRSAAAPPRASRIGRRKSPGLSGDASRPDFSVFPPPTLEPYRNSSSPLPVSRAGVAHAQFSLLSVLHTDNGARVRDGYISVGMRGYARAWQTHLEDEICREILAARARLCPSVPRLNLHGKEGVSGSSPEEGLKVTKAPANQPVSLSEAAPQGTSLERGDNGSRSPAACKAPANRPVAQYNGALP